MNAISCCFCECLPSSLWMWFSCICRIYLIVGAFGFVAFGWRQVFAALGWHDVRLSFSTRNLPQSSYDEQAKWPYHVPEIAYILTFVLALVLGFAVTIMALWHLWTTAKGETSVESQDNEHYRYVARHRGEVSCSAFYCYLCSSLPRNS